MIDKCESNAMAIISGKKEHQASTGKNLQPKTQINEALCECGIAYKILLAHLSLWTTNYR